MASELSTTLRAIGYAQRAYQLYNLVNSAYIAATAVGTAAAAGAGTLATGGALAGIGAFATAVMMIEAANEKNAYNQMKARVGFAKETEGVINQAIENPPKTFGEFKTLMETPSYGGAKLGDVMVNLIHENLTNKWGSNWEPGVAQQSRHPITWFPNEKLQPLGVALKQLGYEPGRVETTGLLTFGGGFDPAQRSRMLLAPDTAQSVEHWDSILKGYASIFPQNWRYPGTVSHQQVREDVKNQFFPTVDALADFVRVDPNAKVSSQAYFRQYNQFLPEIRQIYFGNEDWEAARRRADERYYAGQRAMSTFHPDTASGSGDGGDAGDGGADGGDGGGSGDGDGGGSGDGSSGAGGDW